MGNATSAFAGNLAAQTVAYCASPAQNQTVDCSTIFTDSSNSTVALFGKVAVGTFRADPDVAGIGTIVSFVLPTAIHLLCSLVLILSNLLVKNRELPPWLDKIPIPRPRPPPRYKRGKFENWVKQKFPRLTWPSISSHFHTHPHHTPRATPHNQPQNTIGFPLNVSHASPSYYLQDQPLLQPKHPTSYSDPITPAGPTLSGHGNDEDSPYQAPSKTFEEPAERGQSKKTTKLSESFYDVLEALMFFISDAQILLALAFSLYFIVSDRCTVSQYHIKIGLNLWLTAATITVFSLTVVRNCFERLGSGLFRIALLAFSLIFSLGFPLGLQVSSGFASEIVPSDGRNSSQIFLNALCFMDSSFRKVVVDDQINNHAVIGACITHPELSQEFISWVAICVIWAVIMLGRFGIRARSWIRDENNNFADSDSGRRAEAVYWCFLLLIWGFAVGTFGYRTWLISDLRRWVANSPWIQDPNPETYLQGFGQWASIISIAAIFLVVLDHDVSGEDEE